MENDIGCSDFYLVKDHVKNLAYFANILNGFRDVVNANNEERGWNDNYHALMSIKDRPELLPVIEMYITSTELALIHSEISEALEGVRKGLMDDHLPHRPMIEVELADAIIRIMHLAGRKNLDIGGAVVEKYAYNKDRADHKKENRNKADGKKF